MLYIKVLDGFISILLYSSIYCIDFYFEWLWFVHESRQTEYTVGCLFGGVCLCKTFGKRWSRSSNLCNFILISFCTEATESCYENNSAIPYSLRSSSDDISKMFPSVWSSSGMCSCNVISHWASVSVLYLSRSVNDSES